MLYIYVHVYMSGMGISIFHTDAKLMLIMLNMNYIIVCDLTALVHWFMHSVYADLVLYTYMYIIIWLYLSLGSLVHEYV